MNELTAYGISLMASLFVGSVLYVLGVRFGRDIERVSIRRKQPDNLPRGDDGGVIPGHSSKAWLAVMNHTYEIMAEQKKKHAGQMGDVLSNGYKIRQLILVERERHGSRHPMKARGVVLARAVNGEGNANWCVMYSDGDFVLDHTIGRFVIPPMNSDMTDEFWRDTRFGSVSEALVWWEGEKGDAVRAWADGIAGGRP